MDRKPGRRAGVAMAGERRRDTARARLRERDETAVDDELVARALASVADAVERRDPLSDDQANREVSAEVRKMRAEKRAKAFVAAHARG